MAFALSNVSLGDRLRHRLAALQQLLEARAARRRVCHRTFDELNALSDRDLADLGLHRTEIQHVAREAAYGV